MELTDLLPLIPEQNASDMHLVPKLCPMVRVDGHLVPARIGKAIVDTVLESAEIERMIAIYLTEEQKLELARGRDINTSIEWRSNRFRCCLFRDRTGVNLSLRLIPNRAPQLQELYTPETENVLRSVITQPRGLVLCVGGIGSGKSTTLAAFIETINQEREERIITIETPSLAYVFTNKKSIISQRQVGREVESIEQGAISAMQSDMDIALISELQTPEAVRIALALAENGYLVFTTLNARTASEAIQRLMESFPEPRDAMNRILSRTMVAVIAQMLVPRAGGAGRVAANEIMLANNKIRKLIAAGNADLSLAIEAGRNDGMCTMDDSILKLYRDGVINYEAAWSRMEDKTRLGMKE